MKRAVSILGSTGSIGRSTLDVVRALDGRFRVRSLAARSSWKELADQAEEFRPERVALADEDAAGRLRGRLPAGVELLSGPEALAELASDGGADVVVLGVVGVAGLRPALAALETGHTLALANKEPLVAAGALVMRAAARGGGRIIPVDSEHSAIFQAMRAGGPGEVRRIILTASGGPFRSTPAARLHSVTPEEALAHPTWSMGPKVTVDSATMMNKALEVVEAHWLFGLPPDRIEVWVHPQSVVHSIVEFVDGSMIAQMGKPDMRLPIQYALTWPERVPGRIEPTSLEHLRSLTFERPDPERFPAVGLGARAAAAGGTMGAVLNAANEVAVERFLAREIPFTAIAEVVRRAMDSHEPRPRAELEDVLAADAWAREFASSAALAPERGAG